MEITGLTAVPEAGDLFEAVEDERLARELAEQRVAAAKEKQFSSFQKVTLDNLFSQMAQNDMKELAIVVKADVQGSAEAVKQSLEKISNDEVRVRVIHAGVGAISKSDVDLADASNAIIIGFTSARTMWPRKKLLPPRWKCVCTASSMMPSTMSPTL